MLASIIRICTDYNDIAWNIHEQLDYILTNDEWDDCSYNVVGLEHIKWFLNQVIDFINEHDENVFSIDGQKIVGSIFKKDIEKIEDLIIKIELIIEEDNNEND